MMDTKDRAIVWSDRLQLVRLTEHRATDALTTILYHGFRFGDETWETARDRLKRQCDFLATAFRPVSIKEVQDGLEAGRFAHPRALLVTIDDAKRDILDVIDIFEEFDIPLVQFVCAGWSAGASDDDADQAPFLRFAASLQHYQGGAESIRIGDRAFTLESGGNAEAIEAVIDLSEKGDPAALPMSAVTGSNAGQICTWAELRDLQARSVVLGCHSASHPQIARQSARRQAFEITAAHRLIEARTGPCAHFAYPYGIPGSYNDETHKLLKNNNFSTGFTTAPALAAPDADPLSLPRIVLPDKPMSDIVFRARVRGGGIPLTRLKDLMGGGKP